MHDPVVFISSTSDDLKEHREQASKAAMACGFSPRKMEYFPARGDKPSLDVCLEKVDEAKLVVVLVAHRYGWVPDEPRNPDAKSITWLECDHARKSGIEVLAFLVDPAYSWPLDHRENYRLIIEQGKRGIRKEVQRNQKKLAEFRSELSKSVRSTFTDPASVRALVSEALADWHKRHPSISVSPKDDPDTYLKALEDDTRQIRIRGLKTKRAEPYFFGIDEIYIPLNTLGARGMREMREEPKRVPLEEALQQRKLLVIGEPGAGKSTFLRRVAFELCRNQRGTRPAGAPPFLGDGDRRFPILLRAADFAQLLASEPSARAADSPGWVAHFLGRQAAEYKWGVGESFFQRKLEEGDCLLMVDGLDEAPERRVRERIARIFEKAAAAFKHCHFLATTRPSTNEGESVLEGFHALRIGDLEPPEIATFFQHFARALVLSEAEAVRFKGELHAALDGRPEIREMARNPVMLTALAVLQHNDQRLPEYRVELYDSILRWLAAAREHKPGRPSAEECLKSLRKLALRMQDAPDGSRLVQFNTRAAAEFLVGTDGDAEALHRSLERETEDSGIISSVGTDLRFWHLSFQEYLAALEIGGLGDRQQFDLIFQAGKLYRPEWRETMRLLGGVLFKQGDARIEGLIQAILAKTGTTLAEQVRSVALLSAMMRDLSRMNYTPKSPDYDGTVKAVMGIFEAGEAEKIPIEKRIEAADLLGQVGDPRLEDDNWVTIPAGEFYMGAQKDSKKRENYDPKARSDESPVHAVNLPGFRIRRYPVTVQEFGAFVRAGGYSNRKYWAEGFGKFDAPGRWEEQQEHPNWPVTDVSWYEAAAYCALAKCRLPTEEEWERAARGPDSARYPWGNEPPLDPARANYEGIPNPTPVGLYPKGNTAEGVCDMLGNVWEWCADWYGQYGAAPKQEAKVLRGGSWGSDPGYVRVSCRIWYVPPIRYVDFGFRCAGD